MFKVIHTHIIVFMPTINGYMFYALISGYNSIKLMVSRMLSVHPMMIEYTSDTLTILLNKSLQNINTLKHLFE